MARDLIGMVFLLVNLLTPIFALLAAISFGGLLVSSAARVLIVSAGLMALAAIVQLLTALLGMAFGPGSAGPDSVGMRIMSSLLSGATWVNLFASAAFFICLYLVARELSARRPA